MAIFHERADAERYAGLVRSAGLATRLAVLAKVGGESAERFIPGRPGQPLLADKMTLSGPARGERGRAATGRERPAIHRGGEPAGQSARRYGALLNQITKSYDPV